MKDKQLKNEVIFELTPTAQLLDLGTERLANCAIWAGCAFSFGQISLAEKIEEKKLCDSLYKDLGQILDVYVKE